MTTKFLDNKIFTFKILLSWRFPRKQAFLDDFSSLPPRPPPPQKRKFYFYCRLAVSDFSVLLTFGSRRESRIFGALSHGAPRSS